MRFVKAYRDRKGDHRFRVIETHNGKITLAATEGYRRHIDMVASAEKSARAILQWTWGHRELARNAVRKARQKRRK